jgi:Fic family protein
LAELEQAGELIPNQGILINTLPLLEAQASSEIDPLMHMAVMHYQFEAIRPFIDGNGRTGRVLNSLFLIEAGLLTLPILHLSRYIIRNWEDYYRLLIGVSGDKAWEPWILYVLRGVEETAAWTQGKRGHPQTILSHGGVFPKHTAKVLQPRTVQSSL